MFVNTPEKALDFLAEELKKLRDTIATLELAAKNDIGVPKQRIPYKLLSFTYDQKDGLKYSSIENLIEIRDKALKTLDEIFEEDKKIYQQNVQIAAENKQIYDRIAKIMINIGVPDKIRIPDPKSRSYRSTKYIDQPAGYIADLNKVCNLYTSSLDSYSYTAKKKTVSEFYDKIINEKKAAEQKRKQEQAIEEKNQLEAVIKVKYGMPYVYEENQILADLLDKNKYLSLAHWLSMNRGDWSDGCDYAETGIANFVVVTDEDRKIFETIMEIINNWGDHGDGRVFRDCEWSYSVLFAMAEEQNKELYEDYQNLMKYSSNY
jgi:hypothetical protein